MERIPLALSRFLYRLKLFTYRRYIKDLLNFYKQPLHLRILQTLLPSIYSTLLFFRFSLLAISVKNDWPSYRAIDTTLNAMITRYCYDPEMIFSFIFLILFGLFFYLK